MSTSELSDPATARVIGVGAWAAEHRPNAATQASITKAAAGDGVRNVCRSIVACVAAAGTAQTPVFVVLRDGATGAGAVLWSGVLSAPVNSAGVLAVTDLNIIGSPNTAMTLEFTAAGVTDSRETVAMTGYLAKQ